LPFTEQPYLPRSFQPEVTTAYRQGFAYGRTDVIEEKQQGTITFSLSTPSIYGSCNSTGLFRLQIDGSSAHCSLFANSKNATVLACPRDVLSLRDAAQSRERPRVGNYASQQSFPRFRFDMIQERKHAFGLEIYDSQVGYRFVLLIGQKLVEQFQRHGRLVSYACPSAGAP
jgi:hypothetical protein